MSNNSPISFAEQPFHKVISTPIDKLTENELRQFVKDTNQKVQSPARRRADNVKESKTLTGQRKPVDISAWGLTPDANSSTTES